jgi:hypothetical protein
MCPYRVVPENIREILTMRYEYVVAEKEIVPDLTDALRNCDTCSKWCPPYVYCPPFPDTLPNQWPPFHQTRDRPMRSLQVLLPHGVCTTTT